MFGKRKGATGQTFSQLSKAGIAPTVANAPYLKHFFCRDSIDIQNNKIRDLRGNLVVNLTETGENTHTLEDHGDHFYTNSELGTLDVPLDGDIAPVELTDDLMIVAVGSKAIASAENSMIFRLGSNLNADGNTGGYYKTSISGYSSGLPVINLPDQFGDVDGSNVSVNAMYAHPPSEDLTSSDAGREVLMRVFVIDNGSSLARSRTWSTTQGGNYTGGTQVESVDISATLTKAIRPNAYRSPAGAYSTVSMQGHFNGIGVWTFPSNSLPQNWYEAAVSMGYAWIDGRYHFYPF